MVYVMCICSVCVIIYDVCVQCVCIFMCDVWVICLCMCDVHDVCDVYGVCVYTWAYLRSLPEPLLMVLGLAGSP